MGNGSKGTGSSGGFIVFWFGGVAAAEEELLFISFKCSGHPFRACREEDISPDDDGAGDDEFDLPPPPVVRIATLACNL